MHNQTAPNEQTCIIGDKTPILPLPDHLRSKVEHLENQLLLLCNIQPGTDMIYEDVPLDKNNPSLFIHTLRSVKISPNKENFILIHGFLGSSTNYIGLCPYLIDKYNLFIPDTIGMALSSRPQVKFTSTEQCTNFFIDTIEQWRLALKIENFYLCGHSLGGYFAGAYSLKYPKAINKVLLLSPACISNIKNGGNIHKEAGCCIGCGLGMLCPCWCCEPRFQQLYNCSLFTPIVKLIFRVRYQSTAELNEVMAKLSEIAMEYPSDLDKCMWYIFKNPFPKGANPLEDKMLSQSKLNYVICFGEVDWMDQVGSRRLEEKEPNRFKVYTVSRNGHMFILENSNELAEIINKEFV